MQEEIRVGWTKPNPFRSKLVFLEGIDKTGKTRLCQLLRRASEHTVSFHDRGIASKAVYTEFRKQTEFPLDDWLTIEDVLIKNEVYAVVWLRAGIDTVVDRHFAAGEMCEFSIEEYRAQDELYAQHLRSIQEEGVPVLELWTDQLTEEQCIDKILRWAQVI